MQAFGITVAVIMLTPTLALTQNASVTGSRQVSANYDFVPGQRTLFYTDFGDEEVGNFPRRLQFKLGSMEVVELDGKRALKASAVSGFVVPLPEILPQKFTIEIDVINRNSMGVAALTVKLYGGVLPKTDADRDRTRVAYGHLGWEVSGGGVKSEAWFPSPEKEAAMGQLVSVRVLGDSSYLKLYADGQRLSNVPTAHFTRGKGIYVALEARNAESGAVYVTRIRIAESQRTIYDALKATGRWATQGILFETGKAEIRAESAPTLKQIGDALREHPELRVRIEGHTDNVGKPEANLVLSEARALAVKSRLVSEFGVDAARLESVGLGDSKPATPNTTPEGRANNRRVEVVKL